MKKKDHKSTRVNDMTIEQVEALDQEASGGRGENYYAKAMISRATVYQNHISGRIGNYLEFHDVKITFHDNELASNCTCRSSRKICKHIVALLYAWVNDRDDFLDVQQVLDKVRKMNQDQLIVIVENILRQYPEFADIFMMKKAPDWDEIGELN
jgi:uncharacterized Zn finger protein